MLALEEARQYLLDAVRPVADREVLPVTEADGRYLAEAVTAPAPSPGFDNSAMDGYALRVADWPGAETALPVAATVAAGEPAGSLAPGSCARIFTGAPVPAGADAVVPQERAERDGETVRFEARPDVGANIRRTGEDVAQGAVVAEAGRRMTPALISALITVGVGEVAVARRPQVLVLSTGSELQAPGAAPREGGVYDSNRPALVAALASLGAAVTDGGCVPDDPAALSTAFAEARRYDAVLTSGGVSVGDYDHVRAMLDEAGSVDFWKVAIKPGKPFAFGTLGGAYFFGLPGNPVSALVTFEQFVRPALIRLMGGHWQPARFQAVAGADLQRKPGRTEFVRARLTPEAGRLVAYPLAGQGSGMIGALAQSQGYIVVDADSDGFAQGDMVTVEPGADWCSYGEPHVRGEA
jgi:molybdopterin molybdotransferase